MTPTTIKTLMTIGAAVLGALMFVPQLAQYREPLMFLAGALGGGAHVPRPGDLLAVRDATEQAKTAKAALADALEEEK